VEGAIVLYYTHNNVMSLTVQFAVDLGSSSR